ncbi:DUF481 domain-containing protein [Hydrogenimonas sp.]
MRKSVMLAWAAAAVVATAGDMQVGEFRQHVELAYLGTSGNSDSNTLSALYSNEYQATAMDDIHFRADAYYGDKDGVKTDERYRAHIIGNHHFDPKWYAYAEAGALRNTFEGYNQQYNGGLGVGYMIFDDATQTLKVRGGYQYRYANLTTGDDEDFHYAKLGVNHDYRFNEKTELVSELNALEDLEETNDYEIVFRTALKTALMANFSLKVGFEVKYDNTPVEGKDTTDTTTTVGIVYDF